MLPGVVRGVAARELVLACREFFERSYAWQTLIEDQNAKSGRKQYWLSPLDEYTNIIAVLGVAYKGQWLARMASRPPRRTETTTASTPQGFYSPDAPDSIELYPDLDHDEDAGLAYLVALTPKISVEHLPRVAEIKYYDAILDGFLARMFMHPNKPYSSLTLAQAKRKSFNSWIGRYAGQAKQGNINAQNWVYPSGWGVRRYGVRSGV